MTGHRTPRPGWSRVTAAVGVAVLSLAPFAFDSYTLSQLNRVMALGLLAASVAVLTNYCGLPTLGQVAPFAVGVYGTHQLAEAGIRVGVVQLAVVIVGCGLFALVTGPLVLRTRGITFLMVTLAVGMLVFKVAEQWTPVTGGTDGTGLIEASLPWWGADPLVDDGDIYWYTLTVGVIVVLVTGWMLRGTPGAVLRGIRDDERRMHACGHRVTRRLLAAYVGAGAIAGVGGSLYATGQRIVSPTEVGFEVAAITLLAVMIGGMASVAAAIAGVVVIMAVRYWLSPQGQGELWLGVLFVASVYLLPTGLAGRLQTLGRPRITRIGRSRGRAGSG